MTTATPSDADTPVRDGSRYGCGLCRAPVRSARARYCSAACRQRAYRLRQGEPGHTGDEPAWTAARQHQGRLAAQRVYECPDCEQRFLGERRCPDCNRFCRGLGLGGRCPHCEEVVLLSELLEA